MRLTKRIAAAETVPKIADARIGDFRGSLEAKSSREDVRVITARYESLRADVDRLALALRFVELNTRLA